MTDLSLVPTQRPSQHLPCFQQAGFVGAFWFVIGMMGWTTTVAAQTAADQSPASHSPTLPSVGRTDTVMEANREDDDSIDPLATLSDWIEKQSIEAETSQAMIRSIGHHPDEERWSGSANGKIFAVVLVKSNPQGPARQAIRLAAQRRSHMLAVNEMLQAKSLLDAFASNGLEDAVTLRKAVLKAGLRFEGAASQNEYDTLQVKGSGRLLRSASKIFDESVASYVLANASELVTHLTKPPQLERVKAAYREVMHTEARRLMQLQQWEEALELWHHLHSRELVSPSLYVDAATCFHHREEDAESLRLLDEAFQVYRESGSMDFFERVGDLAMLISDPDSDAIAIAAYDRARELLR